MPDPYEKLAEAIIVLACKDYKDELFWLKKHEPVSPEDLEDPKYIDHKAAVNSLEIFFLSQWFHTLTTLDGEELMHRIRKEFVHDDE